MRKITKGNVTIKGNEHRFNEISGTDNEYAFLTFRRHSMGYWRSAQIQIDVGAVLSGR